MHAMRGKASGEEEKGDSVPALRRGGWRCGGLEWRDEIMRASISPGNACMLRAA
jgi:hypothetical protein